MNTVIFDVKDTNVVIQKLQKRGFTRDQAEGVVEVLTEHEFVTGSALDVQTKKIETIIVTEIATKHVSLMKWITGVLIAQAAAIVALLQIVS